MIEDYYLIVYNICGISGKDNTDYYIEAINSITRQTFKKYKLIVSSCLNPSDQIRRIETFCQIDMINVINETLTVNTTFNQAVHVGVEHFGKPKGVLYLDSGIKFTSNDQLGLLVKLFESGNYGMASAQVDADMGWNWFGLPENCSVEKNFIVPLGKAVNLHCQIFHIDIFLEFNNIMPDIFRSYCTESTFSFLNASVGMEWIASGNYLKVHHRVNFLKVGGTDGIDGHSIGFKPPPGTWNDCWEPYDINSIIADPEASACGFGYEECRSVLNHNKKCYINDRFCKDPSRLSRFIKKNIFRDINNFDYSSIMQETIICSN